MKPFPSTRHLGRARRGPALAWFCVLAALGCARGAAPNDESGPVAAGAAGEPSAVSDASALSVRAVQALTKLTQPEPLEVVGYAVSVEPCPECPADVACAPCLAQVLLGDTPTAGAREVLSVVGDFFAGQTDFEQGKRYLVTGQWLEWRPAPEVPFGVMLHASHAELPSR